MKRGSGDHQCANAPNKNLCLPKSYSKFELPHTEDVNVVEIGIDIIDVLRINDKVRLFCHSPSSGKARASQPAGIPSNEGCSRVILLDRHFRWLGSKRAKPMSDIINQLSTRAEFIVIQLRSGVLEPLFYLSHDYWHV